MTLEELAKQLTLAKNRESAGFNATYEAGVYHGAKAVLDIIKKAKQQEYSWEGDSYILNVKIQGIINELEGVIDNTK